MGIARSRLVYYKRGSTVTASQMYFSCVAPHYHPYTYQKAHSLLLGNASFSHSPKQLPGSSNSGGKTEFRIVYLSRRGNSRYVINEEPLLDAIEAMLTENNNNNNNNNNNAHYTLDVFKHSLYPTLDDTIEYFSQARVLIGPHGGAFYNQIFCPAGTLIIEMFPYESGTKALRWPESVWWPAQFLGHNYYQIPESSNFSGDIQPDIAHVVGLLRTQLFGN
eukprot:TRINITY_DN1941_c0_g1_i10.p1 TRINITY_DN1941_c0_g1~~TRINITY_DN1941_c0_g1_i10.p1  ORF type:complete len:235 (-),score=52.91 TRINITY_DN1941_c0_g1_i10:940-1599(-)